MPGKFFYHAFKPRQARFAVPRLVTQGSNQVEPVRPKWTGRFPRPPLQIQPLSGRFRRSILLFRVFRFRWRHKQTPVFNAPLDVIRGRGLIVRRAHQDIAHIVEKIAPVAPTGVMLARLRQQAIRDRDQWRGWLVAEALREFQDFLVEIGHFFAGKRSGRLEKNFAERFARQKIERFAQRRRRLVKGIAARGVKGKHRRRHEKRAHRSQDSYSSICFHSEFSSALRTR